MDLLTLGLLQMAVPVPFAIAAITETEKHDAELAGQFQTIASTWDKPANFDKIAELQQCLVKYAHRIGVGQPGDKKRYLTVGEEDGRLTLTISKWPVNGDIKTADTRWKTPALTCLFEDGKVWNAKLSDGHGDWYSVNARPKAGRGS